MIKDFIFFTAADAVRDKSMPGMKELVENGVATIGYNVVLTPLLKRFNFAGKVTPDLLNVIKKWASYTLLKGGARWLFYKEKFDFGMHAIDSAIAVIALEVYDFAIEGKMKLYM